MPSLQRGYEELGQEQLERLQQEINNIKNNYRKANVSDSNEVISASECAVILIRTFFIVVGFTSLFHPVEPDLPI